MLTFTRLEGPYGIPVFYQQLPEIVRSTAIALTVFTGGGDDISVGQPGIYHWFEHVPFRGTKKFPDGYLATKGPVTRVGGKVGAWTSWFCTNFWATLPTRHLNTGLDIVVDLVAQPLLAKDAIIAEREIINQEIRDRNSNPNGKLGYLLPQILWPGHPLGSSVLGSIKSLAAMTPELLQEARKKGYDRSRMAFFISSALPCHVIMSLLDSRFGFLPDNNLKERRAGASYAPLESLWECGKRTEIETEFSTSIVKKLFWIPPFRTKRDLVKLGILSQIFGHGGNGSPLMRAIRENRQLAYSAQTDMFTSRDGGYWGFSVNTSLDHVQAAEEALPTMLQDPQLRSKEWFEDIKEAARNSLDMQAIDPDHLVDTAVRRTMLTGDPWNEEEITQLVVDTPHEQLLSWLDEIDFSKARTVIALGKG
jgi:predicted Zn-dependent peptidase